MKLGYKLLAAPLMTAVVVIAAGQINGYLQNVQAEKGLASSQVSLDLFKTMAAAQQQMAEVHAGVYRTVPPPPARSRLPMRCCRSSTANCGGWRRRGGRGPCTAGGCRGGQG